MFLKFLNFSQVKTAFGALFCALFFQIALPAAAIDLTSEFNSPPTSARPWVYWMWLSGNMSKESITADLEAMQRVGIGGVLLLDVENGTPPGDVKFFDENWQGLFKHTVAEAMRLGMEINMNNGVGYFGSGGPWVKPEMGMQWVFTSETPAIGSTTFNGILPLPKNGRAYKDIAVLAVPKTKVAFQIHDFEMKALYWKTWVAYRGTHSAALDAVAPAGAVIPMDQLIDLTAQMKPDGHLMWDVPAGDWVILRIGHACNGSKIGPAVADQTGLETDKLSRSATEFHFNTFVKHLSKISGQGMNSALVGTHIDSWEGGGQNWTAGMREEFKKRRGYDPLPYLPIMSDRILGSLQITERFLWDLRKTVSEMMVENYVSPFQKMAHEQGLRFTFESYTTTGNDLDAANHVDEPMAEFWTPNGQGADFYPTAKSMSSAAHINGRAIVGAEAFTSGATEKWLWHPAMFKDIGDDAFTQGINRFVFHRYTGQRFLNQQPGLQMGPWGLHYERTNTWWEWTQPWHSYLSRCQYLLRKGEFVADVLSLQSEEPLERFQVCPTPGYDYDICGPDSIASVRTKDGCVTLPSGRSYRLLTLNHGGTMTLPLLQHLNNLVENGAAILGSPPKATPGLTGYPQQDVELVKLAEKLWGRGNGVVDRRVGKGRVFSGISTEEALKALKHAPDFTSSQPLRWIHREVNDSHFYFLANPFPKPLVVRASFRVTGMQPQLWNPENGTIKNAAFSNSGPNKTEVLLNFEPKESIFVVFSKDSKPLDGVMSITRNGLPAIEEYMTKVVVEKATYGVAGDPGRTTDVRNKVIDLLKIEPNGFHVGALAKDHDPAFGAIKTLILRYSVDGQSFNYQGIDTDRFEPVTDTMNDRTWVEFNSNKQLVLNTSLVGKYQLTRESGNKISINIDSVPELQEITGPWQVIFNNSGENPKTYLFERLSSWSEHLDDNVKYFSGTATYNKTISITRSQLESGRLDLDLGNVQVMARIKLNGVDLGILWKAPYRVEITPFAREGENTLEISVVNLWPNALIGDEQKLEDSDRKSNGTLKNWPQWLLQGNPSPTGRKTFSSWRLWKKDDALLPSGLLGPVKIQSIAVRVCD